MTPSDAAAPVDRLWAVVPAGGAGTRLWPLSRAGKPKFLLDLTDSGRTLIQATVDRLTPLVGERVLVVTGVAHDEAVRRQLPEVDRVIAEPSPRDSMAAIGLAAAQLELEDPDALIGSFAADHVITDQAAFAACVREAAEVAAQGLLVTIGIEPTYAGTGFGYVRGGAALDGHATARVGRRVRREAGRPTAEAYLETGEYRWNGGIFVVRASTLLDLLAENHPELADGLRAIAADPDSMDERWPGLTKIAIDHAVAEPAAAAGRVAMVPGRFGWRTSVTSPRSRRCCPTGPTACKVLGDESLVVAPGSTGLVVPAAGRTVAVVGLEDVVVVDTGDALLVTTYAHAQEVKAAVEVLQRAGRRDLT